MESAIAPHLRVERLRQPRATAEFTPPYPTFVARYSPSVERLVVAYFGIQYRGEAAAAASAAAEWLETHFRGPNGPKRRDRAQFFDRTGFVNLVSAAYWEDESKFAACMVEVRKPWTDGTVGGKSLGLFIEAALPAVDRLEAMLPAKDWREGMAGLADHVSDEIREHAYWGSMRDRIPLSQTSDLAPLGEALLNRDGLRIEARLNENISLIRSGQDWSNADQSERRIYLSDVEPVLRQGMEFLDDEGLSIGCYANRFMTAVDDGGKLLEKTYGMSWWKSLEDLEAWAESHRTHVQIFRAAHKYMAQFGANAKLRLHHEVMVVRSNEQIFDYYNCHEQTGILRLGGLHAAR